MENIQYIKVQSNENCEIIRAVSETMDYYLTIHQDRAYAWTDWYGEDFMIEGLTMDEAVERLNNWTGEHSAMEDMDEDEIKNTIEELMS